MPNEQKDRQSKKTPNQVSLWLSIGIAIGTSLGIIFHNIPIGVGIGIGLGLVIGFALSQNNKKDWAINATNLFAQRERNTSYPT